MSPKKKTKVLGEEGQNQHPRESNGNHRQNNNNGVDGQSPKNNRWNDRQNNQHPPLKSNQQINQVVTTAENDHSDNIPPTINKIESNGKSYCPYIRCTIEGGEIEVLVDTGATISVLTKEIADIVTKKDPTIPQLPLIGVKIRNAVGIEIFKTSKQIFCRCQFGEATIFANFVQVEGLNERGIIGADILKENKALIDFKNRTVQIRINEHSYSLPFSRKLPLKEGLLEEILQGGTVTEDDDEQENSQVAISSEEGEKYEMNSGPTTEPTTSSTPTRYLMTDLFESRRQRKKRIWYEKKKNKRNRC